MNGRATLPSARTIGLLASVTTLFVTPSALSALSRHNRNVVAGAVV